MPRIAAALTVLATTAFSIGFNIVRYPVVWDQLAAIERLSQSTELAEPAATASGSWAEADSEPSDSDAWGDDFGEQDRVVASISGGSSHGGVEESREYGSNDSGYGGDEESGDDWDRQYSYSSGESEHSQSSVAGDDDDEAHDAESWEADLGSEPVAGRSGDGTVRRLPSVDVWQRNPHVDEHSGSGFSMRAYPSTGRQ